MNVNRVFKNRTDAILVAKVNKAVGLYLNNCFRKLNVNRVFKNRTDAILVAKVNKTAGLYLNNCFRQLPDLTFAIYQIFCCRKGFDSHRSAGMHLLGADSKFRAKAEFTAVCKTSACIYINAASVDSCLE